MLYMACFWLGAILGAIAACIGFRWAWRDLVRRRLEGEGDRG